jgi:hypothetical protein
MAGDGEHGEVLLRRLFDGLRRRECLEHASFVLEDAEHMAYALLASDARAKRHRDDEPPRAADWTGPRFELRLRHPLDGVCSPDCAHAGGGWRSLVKRVAVFFPYTVRSRDYTHVRLLTRDGWWWRPAPAPVTCQPGWPLDTGSEVMVTQARVGTAIKGLKWNAERLQTPAHHGNRW